MTHGGRLVFAVSALGGIGGVVLLVIGYLGHDQVTDRFKSANARYHRLMQAQDGRVEEYRRGHTGEMPPLDDENIDVAQVN